MRWNSVSRNYSCLFGHCDLTTAFLTIVAEAESNMNDLVAEYQQYQDATISVS